MKIYISHSSSYDYTNRLYNPIKNSNLMKEHEIFFPHDDINISLNARDIISKCDLLIAEASLPTTGQGIEIGWADYAGTTILCVYEKDAKISSALKFITNNFIEYENIEDMINKINDFIHSNFKE